MAYKTFGELLEVKEYDVIVCTKNGTYHFDNLEKAKEVYPELDPKANTAKFTHAMHNGENDGKLVVRFEDWYTYDTLSR